MRLQIRATLLTVIVALMATSLGAVATFVLLRNEATSRAVADLEVDEAARAVQDRIGRFLENAPSALTRLRRLVDGRFIDLTEPNRLADYFAAELRVKQELAWLSFSDAETGAFVGVTWDDGKLVLNRSAPDVDGGRAREWEIAQDNARVPLPARKPTPYDPRTAPWFMLGLGATKPAWTDLYEFAEGDWGISAVLALRAPQSKRVTGVATADYHLRAIAEFLEALRIGNAGHAAVIAALPSGGSAVLGAASHLPPEAADALHAAADEVAAAEQSETVPAAESARRLERRGATLIDIRPLELGPGLRWYLAMAIPADEIEGPIRRATRDTMLVSLAFLVAGIAAAIWVASAISRPIQSMSADLHRVGELELSPGPPARHFIRELDAMSVALGRMKAGLGSFAFYVPVELVRTILRSGRVVALGGETRVLTILFSDITGFTRIAEGVPPESLVRDLGGYFDCLERSVTEAGGVVDKFMGDGALVFFNAPEELPDHAVRACTAALLAQERIEAFNAARERRGAAPFRTRIGLALGPVVVGNIGTPHRFAYTAIGDIVNLASRLEALNKIYGTSIVAAGEVREATGRLFEWRHLDRVAVVGRAAPVELFELLGRADAVAAARLLRRDRHEAALAALMAADFDAAEREFTLLRDEDPSDRAAAVLLAYTQKARSGDRLRHGDWSGVHVYTSKTAG